jgi:hypothetical protein
MSTQKYVARPISPPAGTPVAAPAPARQPGWPWLLAFAAGAWAAARVADQLDPFHPSERAALIGLFLGVGPIVALGLGGARPLRSALLAAGWAGGLVALLPHFTAGPAPTPQILEAPSRALADGEIALPYEGDGRRLTMPVVFEQAGRTSELYLLLDTGATYTSVPTAVLEGLGVRLRADAPEVTMQTAGGERKARLALLDRVWLGDLAVDGVAVATCDDCRVSDAVGLLGLNVAGGYNLSIDADRHEVVFTPRAEFDRALDIRWFTTLTPKFRRHPTGDVEVSLAWNNPTRRAISQGSVEIRCDDSTWTLPLGAVDAGAEVLFDRDLPAHTPCDRYSYQLKGARW